MPTRSNLLFATSLLTLLGAAGCSRKAPAPAAASQTTTDAAPIPMTVLPDGGRRTFELAVHGKAAQRLFIERKGDAVSGMLVGDEKTPPRRLTGTVRPDGSVALDDEAPRKEGDGGARAAGHLVVHGTGTGAFEWWSESEGAKRTAAGTAIENAPWAPGETELTLAMDGQLGAKLRVHAQLQRDRGALAGFYRYANSREDLMLKGTIDERTGAFALDEKHAKGAVTGRWNGMLVSPRLAAGTWSSADGKRALPFVLAKSSEGEILRGSGGMIIEMRTSEKTPAPNCTMTDHYPEVHGLIPPSRNAQVNAALRGLLNDKSDFSCTHEGVDAEVTYSREDSVRVVHEAGGFLALVMGTWQYQGGAHGLGGSDCQLFDTTTLKTVLLTDVLGPDVIGLLQPRIEADVERFQKENEVENYGGDPNSGSYCYEDATHVSVSFNSYSIAPYAFGAPSFTYDVKDLVARMPPGRARSALFGR
jgi:hypothetical protein